ncbi:hypothetical protein FSOLCH5_010805 [Fusarium solani]
MTPVNQVPLISRFGVPGLYQEPYTSHAVTVDGNSRLTVTAGVVGRNPDGSAPDSLAEQASLAMDNLIAILSAAGAGPRDILILNMFVVDWTEDQFPALQPAFGKLLQSDGGPGFPGSLLVPVTALAYPNLKFEVQVIAALPGRVRSWQKESALSRNDAPPRQVDVAIIGAGFSGLQAAADLQKAGFSTLILEAKDRVGGRSYSLPLASGSGLVELGATWINKDTQPRVAELARKFNLDYLQQYMQGDSLIELEDGTRLRADSENATETPDAPEFGAAIAEAAGAFDAAAADIDLEKCTWAEQDCTLEEWMARKEFSPTARAFTQLFVAMLIGGNVAEIGAHYFLDYIKSQGGFESLASDGPKGAQNLKIKQGTSAIASGMASGLTPGSILLNAPVASVRQDGSGVRILARNGLEIAAKRAVIAIPSNTYSAIKFSPPLPRGKAALVSQTKGGMYYKVIATYSKPWWRDLGLVGKFLSFKGPICFSWDISDPEASQYSLAFFVAGRLAVGFKDLPLFEQEQAVLNHLAALVGPESAHLAHDPLEVNSIVWPNEEFFHGAPSSFMGPDLLSKYGQDFRAVFQHLHFGGAETAYEWKGYLEGALLAGARVAKEVAASLGGGK